MLTLLTQYPDKNRALTLALVNGFCAYDEENQKGLTRSSGRRKTGRASRYFLSGYGKPITAKSDAEAVEKANKILASQKED